MARMAFTSAEHGAWYSALPGVVLAAGALITDPRARVLLAVDWSLLYGKHRRPLMHFIFDGGTVPGGAGIVLQPDELEDWRFCRPGELERHMSPAGLARVRAALAGRASGSAVYQPAQVS